MKDLDKAAKVKREEKERARKEVEERRRKQREPSFFAGLAARVREARIHPDIGGPGGRTRYPDH